MIVGKWLLPGTKSKHGICYHQREVWWSGYHGRSCNDEKLEKTSAKPSHMANIKGPPSSQQKSFRVATTTISNGANVKGPFPGQKSSKVATTTISNRENVKGPLSGQQKSSRVATTTVSNRANVKGLLSSQLKSSRVATATISNRANVRPYKELGVVASNKCVKNNNEKPTNPTSSILKRKEASILKPTNPKPFRFMMEERSVLRNAETRTKNFNGLQNPEQEKTVTRAKLTIGKEVQGKNASLGKKEGDTVKYTYGNPTRSSAAAKKPIYTVPGKTTGMIRL